MALFSGTALKLPGETNRIFVNKSATLSKAPVEDDDDNRELQCDLPPVTNFEFRSSFRNRHGNPVFCFKSVKTGLQVAVIRTSDGPMIKTFVTIPTPDHPDDLLPRVVDSVIHSGSEAYPWDGAVWSIGGPRLLDSFGSVTSAEETIHYLDTSSPSALGILLPIFMDHLLNPTMTDSAFLTEIYHTDPTGDDGGRLYSAVDVDERAWWEPGHREIERTLKRILLRDTAVSFEDEVASASRDHYLARLRDPSLRENEAIQFHRKYFRPDNMYVVVCGHVDPGQIISCMDRVDLAILANRAWDVQQPAAEEPGLADRNPSPAGSNISRTKSINQIAPVSADQKSSSDDMNEHLAKSRPSSSAWGSRLMSCFSCGEGSSAFEDKLPKAIGRNPVRFPTANVEVNVPYTSKYDGEATGIVEMAWLGPSWIDNTEEYVALPLLVNFLHEYDAKCSVSLYQTIQMKDEDSSNWNWENTWVNMVGRNIFKLRIEQVEVSKLQRVASLVSEAIETITVDKWDAGEAMREFLDDRITWDWRTYWEWNGYHHSAVRLTKLMQSGHATDADCFPMILDEVYALETLKSKDGAFWVNLLHKYLGKDKPRIVVCGYPSDKLREEEEALKTGRINRRKNELGEIGLLQQQEILKCAREDLMRRRPKDLTSLFPMPDVTDIYVDVTKRYSNFRMVTDSDDADEQGKTLDQQPAAPSPYFSLNNLPLRAIFTDIPVHQVQFELIMDTTKLDPELRPYLPMFLEAISTPAPLKFPPGIRWAGKIRSVPDEATTEWTDANATTEVAGNNDAAIARVQVVADEDGSEYVPREVVAAEIRTATRDAATSMGLTNSYHCGRDQRFVPYAVLRVQVESERYSEGVRWLRDIMFFSDLTDVRGLDHLREVVNRCVSLAADMREIGEDVARALIVEMVYQKDSNRRTLWSSIGQGKFQEHIAAQFEADMGAGQDSNVGYTGESRQGAEDDAENIREAEKGKVDENSSAVRPEQQLESPRLVKPLRELQDYLRRNVDGFVLHVLGDFRRISKVNDDLQLDKPLREIFLPHCGSGANLATPLVVTSDVSEQRDSKTWLKDELESKTADTFLGRGIILHATDHEFDDQTYQGNCQAYLRQVVRVDFNPWTDLAESAALQVLTEYLSNQQEKLDQALALAEDAEKLLACRVIVQWAPDERLISLSFNCDTPEQLGDAYSIISGFFNQILERGIPEDDDDDFVRTKRGVISNSLLSLESAIDMAEACVFAPFRGIASPGALVKRTIAEIMSLSPNVAFARAGKHVKRLFPHQNDEGTSYCAVAYDQRSDKTARELSEDFREKTGIILEPFESYEELYAKFQRT